MLLFQYILEIQKYELKQVKMTKLLGLFINSKFSFEAHTEYLLNEQNTIHSYSEAAEINNEYQN